MEKRHDTEPVVPKALKNQLYRNIWHNLYRSEARIASRELQRKAGLREKEKSRLGLPDDEWVSFVGDTRRRTAWIALFLGFVAMASSAGFPDPSPGNVTLIVFAVAVFFWVAAAAMDRRTRVVVTNYRVLLGHTTLFSSTPKWIAIHYHQIERIAERTRYNRTRLFLVLKKAGPPFAFPSLTISDAGEINRLLEKQLEDSI